MRTRRNQAGIVALLFSSGLLMFTAREVSAQAQWSTDVYAYNQTFWTSSMTRNLFLGGLDVAMRHHLFVKNRWNLGLNLPYARINDERETVAPRVFSNLAGAHYSLIGSYGNFFSFNREGETTEQRQGQASLNLFSEKTPSLSLSYNRSQQIFDIGGERRIPQYTIWSAYSEYELAGVHFRVGTRGQENEDIFGETSSKSGGWDWGVGTSLEILPGLDLVADYTGARITYARPDQDDRLTRSDDVTLTLSSRFTEWAGVVASYTRRFSNLIDQNVTVGDIETHADEAQLDATLSIEPVRRGRLIGSAGRRTFVYGGDEFMVDYFTAGAHYGFELAPAVSGQVSYIKSLNDDPDQGKTTVDSYLLGTDLLFTNTLKARLDLGVIRNEVPGFLTTAPTPVPTATPITAPPVEPSTRYAVNRTLALSAQPTLRSQAGIIYYFNTIGEELDFWGVNRQYLNIHYQYRPRSSTSYSASILMDLDEGAGMSSLTQSVHYRFLRGSTANLSYTFRKNDGSWYHSAGAFFMVRLPRATSLQTTYTFSTSDFSGTPTSHYLGVYLTKRL